MAIIGLDAAMERMGRTRRIGRGELAMNLHLPHPTSSASRIHPRVVMAIRDQMREAHQEKKVLFVSLEKDD